MFTFETDGLKGTALSRGVETTSACFQRGFKLMCQPALPPPRRHPGQNVVRFGVENLIAGADGGVMVVAVSFPVLTLLRGATALFRRREVHNHARLAGSTPPPASSTAVGSYAGARSHGGSQFRV